MAEDHLGSPEFLDVSSIFYLYFLFLFHLIGVLRSVYCTSLSSKLIGFYAFMVEHKWRARAEHSHCCAFNAI